MPPPPAQETGAQGSMDVLWGAVFIVIAGVVIWWKWGNAIIAGLFTWRSYELSWIAGFWPGAAESRQALLLAAQNPNAITYNDFLALLDESGRHFRLVCSSVLALLGFYLMFLHVRANFKTTHSMQSLLDVQLDIWKHNAPISGINLVDKPLMEGPWSMSLNALEFARQHDLLIESRTKPKESDFLAQDTITVSIELEKADAVFAKQMGRPWTSVNDLLPHEKALFAIFAARAEQDREPANRLLLQISESAKTLDSRLNLTGADALLEKHAHCKQVQQIIGQHAYVLTVMASMLELGRTDGIIATAEFLWLKPRDRALWYMLNNVGRQTAFVEVAGPFAHWIIEKRMRRKLHAPMIREASKALSNAMNDTLYTPEEKS